MNTRLKMALLLHSGESGFAIVIAVSLGIIMILVGLTMTLRSQGDQTLSSAQKQTEQSLAVAEKGVAYYQQFFNASASNKRLAQYSDCVNRSNGNQPDSECRDTASTTPPSWHNAITSVTGFATACNVPTEEQLQQYASLQWRDADNPLETDPNNMGKLQFRLVSYRFNRINITGGVNRGTLIVEGRVMPRNQTAPSAITRLKVDIPVQDGDINNIKVPGVWIGANENNNGSNYGDTDGTGRNRIQGDILVNNCDLSSTTIQTMESSIEGNHQVKKVDITMPTIPAQPRGGAERVIGVPNDPNRPDVEGMIPLGNITSDITLPRPDDDRFAFRNQPGRTAYYNEPKTYAYTVGSIRNAQIKIKPGQKIAIYLSGSIQNTTSISCEDSNYQGNSNYHGTCNPMDLRIFGTGPQGSKICLNGARQLNGFILAPEYNIGVQGGGGIDGVVRGAVWAKQWGETGNEGCGSQTQSGITVEQVGDWDDVDYLGNFASDLARQLPPKVSPSATWEKQRVN